MRTLRAADIASGMFLALLGLVTIVAALDIKSVFGERLPPRTLPVALGASTLAAGLLLSVRAYLYRGEPVPVDWPDRSGAMRLLATALSLVAYLCLIELLGVAVASSLFAAFLVWYLGTSAVNALCVGVAVAVVIQLLFVKLLMLPFPPGLWGR